MSVTLSPAWEQAAACIRDKAPGFQPHVALVLGSGMGFLADAMEAAVRIPFAEIPGFPASTVQGHKGQMVLGTLEGCPMIVMQGRFHYYEGHPMQVLAIPPRMFHVLGVRCLILTNAAGAANPEYRPGDFMLIRDHLNMGYGNPLMGQNPDTLGPRFPDTSHTWPANLLALAHRAAAAADIPVQEGVYLFNTGPSYETPAEVRMARGLGADVVGMSTVPEALAAAHCGLPCLGISYVSNMGAGLSAQQLSHAEVIENMDRDKGRFASLIRSILRVYQATGR